MENDKKKSSKGLVILVILLIIIIIGLVGYICYDKGYLDKIIPTKNKTTEKQTSSEKEKKFDLNEAKELVDVYYVEMLWDNIFTAEDGYDEMTKSVAVVNNTVNSKTKINSCYNFYENNSSAKNIDHDYVVSLNMTGSNTKYSSGHCFSQKGATYYNYSDLNSVYKKLFGKEKDMPKSDFSKYGNIYDYIEDKDVFVQLSCECGGSWGPHYRDYFIQDAKTKGDNLIVKVGYVSLNHADNDNSENPMLTATIGGEEVSYQYSDTTKDTFEKEFTEKYLDKLDSYEFKFKNENNHYVFVEMAKK